jgi:hypothetical protein
MPKKKKFKRSYRNAAPRNAAPSSPRPARIARKPDQSETSLHRVGYTAAGAAGSALLGTILKRQNWAPKTVATVIGAVGAGLAWKGDDPTIRSIGAGVMSAAGGQLAIELFTDHEKHKEEKEKTEAATETAKKDDRPGARLSNVDALPDGALQSAFERARLRYAIGHGERPGDPTA